MIRRAVSNIIIVALLAAWGWSAWQNHQLRAQVAALQGEQRASRMQAGQPRRGSGPSVQDGSWLARADAHIAQAGDALSRADVGRAQRELSLGAQDMQRAVRAPAEQTQTATVRARSQVAHLDAQLRTLQAQASKLSAATAPQVSLLQRQARKLQRQAHALWPAPEQ